MFIYHECIPSFYYHGIDFTLHFIFAMMYTFLCSSHGKKIFLRFQFTMMGCSFAVRHGIMRPVMRWRTCFFENRAEKF